jgi:glycosyltransferase involved in cell wall biosynthesis
MTVSVDPIGRVFLSGTCSCVGTAAVVLEQRFHRTPDGRVWTDGAFANSFFDRYLTVFEAVRVVARVRDVGAVEGDWKLASGARVKFAAVPYYIGPMDYLRKGAAVRRAVAASLRCADAVILRVPGQVSSCAADSLREKGRPYAVEVVGDPYDAFAPGSMEHPLRPVFRHWFRHRMKGQVRSAVAASYVTARVLQQRYPAGPGGATTHYSSVELPDEAFVERPRTNGQASGRRKIVSVGSLACLYKGPDVLLDAGAQCVAAGVDLEITFVGGGRRLPDMQDLADRLGLADRVRFLGQVSAGEPIRRELDRADLFVLPSRAEGLPRAMIEAMARALPAIGSRVGGIPELLRENELVKPGDSTALAEKLLEVINDTKRLSEMSARNWSHAREYTEEVLRERWVLFYGHVRALTERWGLTLGLREPASRKRKLATGWLKPGREGR